MVGGACEFLPVSRSGHLALMESLLGVRAGGAAGEVALRLGAFVALLIFLRRDLRDILAALFARGPARAEGRGMAWFVLVGTLPIAVVALAFHGRAELRISNPILIAALIFLTGEILWLTRRHSLLRSERSLDLGDSICIGLAQVGALLPGMSRCGATISAGLLRDVNGERAARFGFLLSAPVILGAAALAAREIAAWPAKEMYPVLIAEFLGAALAAYLALHLVTFILRRGRCYVIAYYCWAVGWAGAAYFWTIAPPRYW